MERKKIDANGLVNSILLNCLRSFMRPTIKMRMRMRNMRMRMTKRRERARSGRRGKKRRWLMVRRKIDVNGLANSMLSNLVVTFYEIEDEDKDGDEDEYEGENEEEGEREEESEEANGEEENRCKRFENHRPLDPIWAPRECDQEFRASRGPPWAVHPIQKGPPGRPSARPEVAPEGLGAIFELLKKRWFLCYFEPSDRSSGVKGAKKRAKMEDQDAPRGQTPGIKAK